MHQNQRVKFQGNHARQKLKVKFLKTEIGHFQKIATIIEELPGPQKVKIHLRRNNAKSKIKLRRK